MKFYRSVKQYIKNLRFCIDHPGFNPSMTYVKYPKQHDFKGMRVLNVGCGTSTYPSPNVVNIDMFPSAGTDVVWDLSKTPLPFETESFDFIIANHILEHVPNWWECFKELARVVKVGGTIEVWLPGDGGSSQLGYRDHINTINHCSFAGTRHHTRNMANSWEKIDNKANGCVKDLLISATRYALKNYWWIAVWPSEIQSWIAEHLRNVVAEQGFLFTKLPPQ